MNKKVTPLIDGAVLIADDHDVFRLGLSELLRRRLDLGEIVGVSCFDEATRKLEEGGFSLAIFDLGLAGMTGPIDLQLIRRRWPDVIVAVLSASEDRRDILASLEAGVHGYLIKSEKQEEQITHLQSILEGNVYVPNILTALPPEPIKKPSNGDRGLAEFHLTRKQWETLEHLVEGLENKEIAPLMGIRVGTVKMHVGAILRELGARNRTEVAAIGKEILSNRKNGG